MDRQLLRRPRRVFISSTSLDLAAHRAVVNDTIVRLQQFADDMARFGARPDSAIAESVAAVEMADIYLGIFAWRYGTIKPGEVHSITHLEYDEAVRLKLPRLIFLADPVTEALANPVWIYPAAVRDQEHDEQRRALRRLLEAEQVVDTFTTPEDLGRRAAIALFLQILNEVPARLQMPRDLPTRAVGFVGRDAELTQLRDALRDGQSIGIAAAVAGMGGVGKSALAAEVVHQLAGDLRAFPGGISWARCDGRAGAEGQVWIYDQLLTRWQHPLAPQEVAAAPTVAAQVDQREQALRSRLDLPGPALVLLDNVETNLPLSQMLDLFAALGITALVTSRSLPPSPRLRLCELEVLAPDPAVALFVERYQARGGAWDESRDRLATLAVVETLGRLPLAIELAAARVARQRRHVADLAQELREPDVLGKLRDPAVQSASVRYSLQKSLDLLTPAQRVRFAALGLPQGPEWPQPVILALLTAVPPDADAATTPSAADDLDLLVTLSLAALSAPESEASASSAGLPLHVRLHPLLRALAQEEWRNQPPATQQAAVAGLMVGIADFLEDHRQEFVVLQQEEEMWAGAIRQAAQMQVAAESIIDAVHALQDYLYIGGHWRLGMEVWQIHLTSEQILGDNGGQAKSLLELGKLAQAMGNKVQATQYYEEAIVKWRESGNRQGEGATLDGLGLLADELGHKKEAERYYEQALLIHREVHDELGEGITLNNLGSLANSLGRNEEAQAYFEQALVLRRKVGDRYGEETTLGNLGVLAISLGNLEEAANYFEQDLAITREVGDRRGEGITLTNLGTLAGSLGKKEESQAYLEQSLIIFREVGDRGGEGITLSNLGNLAYELDRKEEAQDYYEQALMIRREVGDRNGEGVTLHNLGWLAEDLGRREEAIRHFEQSLAIFADIGMESEAQRERDALATLREPESTPVVDEPIAEEDVPMPAPDVLPIEPQQPDATRRGWRWPWQR